MEYKNDVLVQLVLNRVVQKLVKKIENGDLGQSVEAIEKQLYESPIEDVIQFSVDMMIIDSLRKECGNYGQILT